MHSQTTFFTNSGYIDLFKCSKISMKVIYMKSDTQLPLSDYITHFKAIFRTGKSLMGKLPFVCVVRLISVFAKLYFFCQITFYLASS